MQLKKIADNVAGKSLANIVIPSVMIWYIIYKAYSIKFKLPEEAY